ncbi:YokU family protein [Bacillus salitolerans]|uniref:YokU family protein n=1 Tax=Bacillus salitolerans TaxID=1437434 RepID=A0ABW4LTB9_9BACI
MKCEWCGSPHTRHSENTVYWELPDGSRAIIITNTPCIICLTCEMKYQAESKIDEIEEQLMLINTKELPNEMTYEELMNYPRWLKKNYFGGT